jgi:hypothetical protein
MKKKDIIEIALKIFGACMWLQILGLLDPMILFNINSGLDQDMLVLYLILIILKMIALFVIGYYFIFKSAFVAGTIVKESENEVIHLTIDRKDILKIAVIIIGGITLVASLPLLLDELRTYYINTFTDHTIHFMDQKFLIFYLLQTIIGCLFFFKSDFVMSMVFKKQWID